MTRYWPAPTHPDPPNNQVSLTTKHWFTSKNVQLKINLTWNNIIKSIDNSQVQLLTLKKILCGNRYQCLLKAWAKKEIDHSCKNPVNRQPTPQKYTLRLDVEVFMPEFFFSTYPLFSRERMKRKSTSYALTSIYHNWQLFRPEERGRSREDHEDEASMIA